MTPDQVDALEGMLKLKDDELKYIPAEQRAMVEQFRTMYLDNPEVFKPKSGNNNKKNDANSSSNSDHESGNQNKKKEEHKHDPTKWLQDQKESLEWFTSRHLEFDKGSFLASEEAARSQKEAEENTAKKEREKKTIEELTNMKSEAEAENIKPGGEGKAVGRGDIDIIMKRKEENLFKEGEKRKMAEFRICRSQQALSND